MALALNRIYQLDCFQGLPAITPGAVDLAFADPPFNIGYEYDLYVDQKGPAAYLAWTRDWLRAVATVLKPTGTLWVAIEDEFAAEVKVLAQTEVGLTCRS